MRHTYVRAVLALLTLVGPASSAAGQSDAPGRAPSDLPGVFNEVLDVRVVNIEVVVTDKGGIPVLGLSPDDFVLTVDDEEVSIGYFSEVRGGTALAPGERQRSSGLLGPPALVPGQPVSTSYLVFIDEFFSIARDRDRVLDALQKDLALMQPEDRMAVVAFDGEELEMLSTWSQSTRELERVFKKAKRRPTHGLRRLSERRQFDFDEVLRASLSIRQGGLTTEDFFRTDLTPTERFYVGRLTEQVQRSLTATAATLRSFAKPPGRKVLILLSGGWPFLPANFLTGVRPPLVLPHEFEQGEALFRVLTDAANLLGYTIYSVDVPGFTDTVADAGLAIPGGPMTPGFTGRRGDRTASFGRDSFLRQQEVEYSLRFVADQTGGKAFINSARLEAFSEAVSDTRSYYWIGFSPAREWDNRRHRIEVNVRDSGFRVRSRDSFLDSSRRHEVTMAVESELLFGSPSSESLLQVELGEPARAGKGKMEVPVTVIVPLSEVTFLPSAQGRAARLDLIIAVRDGKGNRAEIPVIPLVLESTAETTGDMVVRYTTSLKLRRERHRAVFAIHDPLSGRILSASAEISP